MQFARTINVRPSDVSRLVDRLIENPAYVTVARSAIGATRISTTNPPRLRQYVWVIAAR